MAIRAYDEIYLSSAQNILGHAVDFSVMSLEISPQDFGDALAFSDTGKQFSKGNPRYVAGMNGCELARSILDDAKIPYSALDDAMYLDKSPEYWAGWALAYYQWYSDRSFEEIFKAVSLEEIINMYPLYHEMDIVHFTERMNQLMLEAYPQTRLQVQRRKCGYSQAELASAADVPLRQIQLLEQRQRDINKTAGITLLKLSKTLFCQIEELLEPEL